MDESINVPIRPQVDETAVRQADASLSRLARNRDVEFNATLNAAQFDKNIGRQLGRITGQADEFSKSMAAANARVIAFGASVGVINLATKAFQGLIKTSIDVEDQIKKISLSGGETYKNLSQVSKGLFEITKYTSTSFKDASAAVLEFSRQGKTLEQSLKAATAALILTKNTGLDAAESVRGLTAVVNVFAQSGLDYADVVNKMAAIDTKFSVSSKDLIEGINRSASVAQEAQVSFEELTSLITLLQEKTGRGGPVIGNSIKTIFTRVQNPEILKDLKNLGILVTDQSQKFLPATQILINLAKGYEKLDANLQKSVLLKVGGGFQIDKIAAFFKDLKSVGDGSRFESIFDVAKNSNSDEAFKRAEEQSRTLEGRLNKLTATAQGFAEVIAEIGFRDSFKDGATKANSLLEFLTKNISGGEGEKSGSTLGKAVVKGLGAAVTGPGALIFAGLFAKSLYELVKFASSALQSFSGITSKNKEQKSIQESIFGLLIRNEKAQQEIYNLEGNRVEQAKKIAEWYGEAANQIERATLLSKQIAPIVFQQGIRTGSGQVKNVNKANAASLAKGYIPNFTSESEAYQNEVANAPAGAKIIRHTNFPLGGGKKAPIMFTNDKETLIPNFGGTGGTAVIPRYRTSADGFIPNFADKANVDKGTLNVDATNFGIGGLSLGTDVGNKNQRYQGGLIGKTKGKELRTRDGQENAYLKSLKGSPLYNALKDYSKVQVSNLPVGAVYSFAKGIRDNETIIKKQFVSRANNQISGSIATFILSELKNLGLKIPSQFENALKSNPQSFDLIDDSSAGGFFEKIVQYASLNGRPVESLKANEKTPFDIYGLAARDAESFGLPSKSFRYVEVKSSIQELYDSITEKFVRQSQIETATPKAGSAANGYIPNFAKDPLKESISREVKATGLPLSKIKVSKDPRLFSASKNPLGLGVTNAKDEPRGMLDVSSRRIAESYASSAFGYIPNFAVKGGYKVTSLSPEQQKLVAQYKEQTGETKNPTAEQFKEYFGKDLILPTKKESTPSDTSAPSQASGPKRGRPTGSTNRKTTTRTSDSVTQAADDADKNKFTGVDRGTMKDLAALSNILDQGGIELNEDVYPGADQPPLTVSETRNYGEAGLTRRARAEQFAQSQLAPNEAEFRKEFLSNEVKGTYSELSDEEFNKLNEKYLKIARKYDDLVEKFETLDKENRLDEKQALTGAKVPGVNVPFKSGSKVGAGNVAASATENAQKASGPKKTKGSSKTAAAGGGSGGGSGGGGNSGGSGSAASDDEGNFSTDKTPLTPAQIEANARFNKQYANELREYSSEKPTESIPATEKSTTASASESAQKTAASSRTRTSKSSGKASGAAGGGGGVGGAGGGGVGGGSFSSGGPIPVNVVAPKPLEVKIVASTIKFGETISDRMIKDVVDKAVKQKEEKQKSEPQEKPVKPFTKAELKEINDGINSGTKQDTLKNVAFPFEAQVSKRYTEKGILTAKQVEAVRKAEAKEVQEGIKFGESKKEESIKTVTFPFEAPPERYTESKILSAKGLEKERKEKEKEAEKQAKATSQAQAIAAAQKAAAEQSSKEKEASFAKARTPSLGETILETTEVDDSRIPRTFAERQADIKFRNSLQNAPSVKELSSQKYFNSLLGIGATKTPDLLTAKDIEAEILKNTPRSRVSLSGISSPDYGKFKLNSVIPQKISPIPFDSKGGKENGVSKIEFSSLPASSLVDLASGKINSTSTETAKTVDALTSASVEVDQISEKLRSLFSDLVEKTSFVPEKIKASENKTQLISESLIPKGLRSASSEERSKYFNEYVAKTNAESKDNRLKALQEAAKAEIEKNTLRTRSRPKAGLALDSSLLTGEGELGGKTVFASLKRNPEQFAKLQSAISKLITQFQQDGKPLASLNAEADKAARELRKFGINIKDQNLIEIARGTLQSEKKRIEQVRARQSAGPNITFSTGTPMEIPESDIRRRSGFSYAVRDQLTNFSNYASSAYQTGRGLLGNFASKSEEEKRQAEIEKQTKSAAESAAALARMFAVTSSASAALSVFGERIANAANAAASFVNAYVTAAEGFNIANQMRGTESILGGEDGATVIGERYRTFRESYDRAVAAGQAARTGSGGTPGTGLAGGLQFIGGFLSGGGLGLIGSSLTAVAVAATLVVQAMNGLDSLLKAYNTDVTTGASELAKITELQKKYNLTLSAGSRSLMDSLSSPAKEDYSGMYGILARRGINLPMQEFEGEKQIKTRLANINFNPKSQGEFYNSLLESSLLQAEEDQRKSFIGPVKPGESIINYRTLPDEAVKNVNSFLDKVLLEAKPEAGAMRSARLEEEKRRLDNSYFEKDRFEKYLPQRMRFTAEEGLLNDDQQAVARDSFSRLLGEQRKKQAEGEFARFEREKGALGVSKEYLMNQLSLYTKINETVNSLTSAEEYILQIRKEDFTTSKKEKDLAELRLKIIQNERQTRQEINSALSSDLSAKLTEKLGPNPFGVTTDDYNRYKKAIQSITVDLDINLKGEELEKEIETRLKAIYQDTLGLAQASATPEQKNDLLKQTQGIVSSIVKTNQQIGDSKANQIKLDNASLREIDKIKFQENSRKEILDARLTIQQKSLSLLKEERDLMLNIKENQLKTSLNTDYNITPRRADLILTEAAPEQQKARAESALKARRDESFSSLRKSVIDYTIKSNPTMLGDSKAIDKLLTTKSEGDLLKALEDAMTYEESQLDTQFKPLEKAADHFKTQTDEALKKLVNGVFDFFGVKKPEEKEILKPGQKDESAARYTKNLGFGESSATFEDFLKTDESFLSFKPDEPVQLPAVTVSANSGIKDAKSEAIKNRARLQYESLRAPIASNVQEDIDATYVEQKTAAGRKIKLSKDFEGGLMGSRIQMNEDIEFFANKMGREIPDSFRDSMVSAMRELANPNSTEPLKNRLLGVANAFLQKINESLMTNLATRITSPLTGMFTPEMKASGGMINGGSGSKDDVPAMLMGGEYVIKKSAVKKYGPSFFDALNNGRIQKFASGGFVEADLKDITLNSKNYTPYGQVADQGLSFDQSGKVIEMDSYSGTEQNKQDAMMRAQSDYYAKNAQTGQGGFYMPGQEGMGSIMGQKNLLSFATQEVAGTKFDKFSSIKNAASIDIGAGSSNLSLFALRDQDNVRNKAYQESRQKSLDLYFGGIDASKEKIQRDEEARLEIERIKQEQKTQYRKMYQGLIRNALITIGTSVAAAGISNAMNSGSQKGLQGKTDKINDSIGSDLSGLKSGDFQGYNQAFESRGLQPGQWADITNTKLSTLESFKYGGAGLFGYGGYKSNQYVAGPSGGAYSWSGGGYKSLSNDQFNNTFKYGAQYGSAMQNNFVPMSRMQRRAAGGYVAGNGLGDNVPTMLNGGEFVVSRQAAQNVGLNKLQQINSGSGESSVSDTISEKLDELIDKLNAVGTVNITVNSNGNGKDESEDSDQNSQDNQKQLARRIKEVVMSVLREEKRLGGILR